MYEHARIPQNYEKNAGAVNMVTIIAMTQLFWQGNCLTLMLPQVVLTPKLNSLLNQYNVLPFWSILSYHNLFDQGHFAKLSQRFPQT